MAEEEEEAEVDEDKEAETLIEHDQSAGKPRLQQPLITQCRLQSM